MLVATRTFAEADGRSEDRPLEGRAVTNLFFEDSTRTRASFTLAARRLGADVIEFSSVGSSLSKGETPADMARVIESMGVDALVIRDKWAGAPACLAKAVGCSVINAGDGSHEHPTQGLLDLYTLGESKDRLDGFDFSGLRVAIVGDLASSRVARSDAWGLNLLGAKVVLVGPKLLVPDSFSGFGGGCEVARDFDKVLPTLDAVIMLRIQFERGSGAALGTAREYRSAYGLTEDREKLMKDDAVVMHPGPVNRGVEIDAPVVDGPRSLVLRQVAVGVSARMAVLAECIKAGMHS
jgi:aspartate carbamoyltransferase catalytic subunit